MLTSTTTSVGEATALLEQGFIQTDDQRNNHQYVKTLGPQHFLIAQENANTEAFSVHDINLTDYSTSELREYTRTAYDSIQQMHESYGRDALATNQVLAELIAEFEASTNEH